MEQSPYSVINDIVNSGKPYALAPVELTKHVFGVNENDSGKTVNEIAEENIRKHGEQLIRDRLAFAERNGYLENNRRKFRAAGETTNDTW